MTYIQDIAKHEGETVTIRGWLHNRRSSGKIHFLQLRDGSGFIQAVMSKAAVGEDLFKQADHLSQETSLSVPYCLVGGMDSGSSRLLIVTLMRPLPSNE